jgi:hypothetical protein
MQPPPQTSMTGALGEGVWMDSTDTQTLEPHPFAATSPPANGCQGGSPVALGKSIPLNLRDSALGSFPFSGPENLAL